MQFDDIVLVFQQCTERVIDDVRVQLYGIQLQKRMGPVNAFGHARQFEQIHLPQLMDERHDLTTELGRRFGGFDTENFEFPFQTGIIDPVIIAASFQGIVNFAGSIGRQYHNRWLGCCHGAQLRDTDLII